MEEFKPEKTDKDKDLFGLESDTPERQRSARSDFLKGWFRFLKKPVGHPEIPDEEEEEENEEDEKKPSGRFRRAARWILNLGKTDKVKTTDESVRPEIDKTPQDNKPEITKDTFTETPTEPEKPLQEPTPSNNEPLTVTGEPEARTSSQEAEELPVEATRLVPKPEVLVPDYQLEHGVTNRSEAGERIVEQGSSADFERRNRKQRRDIRKIKHQIRSMKNEDQLLSDQVNKMEAKFKNHETQNDELESVVKLHAFERTPQHTEGEIKIPKMQLEKIETIINEKAERLREIRLSEAPRPEVILERVTKAAEQNEPLEAVFERRHEIKDKPALRANGSALMGKESAGVEPANLPVELPHLVSLPTQATKNGAKTVSDASLLYKQAAKKGMTAGVLLVFLLVLALLLT